MAGDVVNIKVCSPLKQHSSLTGKCHAICHYSYNLQLPIIKGDIHIVLKHMDITAAAIATIISSSIATIVTLTINRRNSINKLNDQLDDILKNWNSVSISRKSKIY
jgi:hypothetical protein